jgi:HTH-type transcriptional regulator/antitoxin MqsA
MFQCHVCGSKKARQEVVTQVFQLEGTPVLVEDVPAMVCTHCGEAIFEMATIEKIRRMVHGEAKPARSILTEVFEFA